VGVAVVFWVGGLGNISAQTDTEYEAENILRNLKINVTPPEPNAAILEVHRSPPKIFPQTVGGTEEWKLSYFCRHHTSDSLKKIIHEQFATTLFDKKGKETKLVDYTVSSNPAVDQLIVRCPAREDAEAVLELLDLVDIQPIQVEIDCLISEVYADMTYDRETTLAIDNLFGEGVVMKPGGTAFGADVRQLIQDDEYLPAFPGASMREVARSRMGLNIGYFSTSRGFTVLVDLLESRGYLKILMNPTLQVVNGGTAKVSSMQKVPIDRITMRSTQSDYLETKTEYEDVIDSLEITAHVFADGYIGLETTIVLGSKNTPEGVKQIPIITKKEIQNKENRIRQGESLIIGGMRKNEEYAVIRGVPILKDIPLIGFLFSSEDTEERAVETIFILTPTISTNGRPRSEVMAEIKRKQEPTSATGLGKMITDPLGLKNRQRKRERTLEEAEQSRIQAEVEKAQARIAVRQANERADDAQAELDRTKTKAEKTEADAQKATSEAEAKAKAAEKATTEAEAKAKAADEAKAAADKAAADGQSPGKKLTEQGRKTVDRRWKDTMKAATIVLEFDCGLATPETKVVTSNVTSLQYVPERRW
jgi:hypothetical protein